MAISVCIDARDLAATAVSGTGVYAIELVKHLPRSIRASVLVGTRAARRAFDELGVGATEAAGECQIFHRPSQFFQAQALDLFLDTPAHPVITFLDLIAYRTPALFGSLEDHRQYRALSFASLHSAQAVIAISEHGRREILEEFQLAPEGVHAVPLGVDAALFGGRDAESNREVLREHGIAGPYFFCSGSDYPHKNLSLLLRGYAWLRSLWKGAGPVPLLVLIGRPSGAPGGIFELGESPAPGVRYVGAVDRDEVPALYQEALAFVYPSSYEGFGLPILEAMAAGAPVLCSRLTSIPEVAGDAALYLDEFSIDELAQRMLEIATNEDLRRRLVQAGLERVKLFRWEDTARRTAEIYAAVVERPAPDAVSRRQMIATLATRR